MSVIAPTLVLSETGRFIRVTIAGAPNTSERSVNVRIGFPETHEHSKDHLHTHR